MRTYRIPARPARALLASSAIAALVAAASAVAATPAAANPPGPHDPRGTVSSVTASGRTVQARGWAYDPSRRTTNIQVYAVLDGTRTLSTVRTDVANPAVSQKYKTGKTPGFRMSIAMPKGRHAVCIVARDVDAGLNTILTCRSTPLGTRLTATQAATHSPRGAISSSWANKHSVHVRGWATDPDLVSRRSVVVLYVDNSARATTPTEGTPSPRPSSAGVRSAFDILVPTSVGTHVGCVWVVNVGIGSNRFLGCRTMDTRGHASTGALGVPSLNRKVVAEAKKHLGQPYVWGAVGPKRFDCSGLVLYSYRKYGFTTPRVSQDQFRKARLIPASRAVAGDPVFYFDSRGDVYHVGIYLSPGKTVAAVDPASGVRYQRIWDPSSTAYASFTHT